jgi:hypothetical protein
VPSWLAVLHAGRCDPAGSTESHSVWQIAYSSDTSSGPVCRLVGLSWKPVAAWLQARTSIQTMLQVDQNTTPEHPSTTSLVRVGQASLVVGWLRCVTFMLSLSCSMPDQRWQLKMCRSC